jgi:hypothetical protein
VHLHNPVPLPAPVDPASHPQPSLIHTCASFASMLDLLVVGAGPHSLSLVTRLVDDTPDLLTEHERVCKMSDGMKGANAKYSGRSHPVVREHLRKRFDGAALLRDKVLVIHLLRLDPRLGTARSPGGSRWGESPSSIHTHIYTTHSEPSHSSTRVLF